MKLFSKKKKEKITDDELEFASSLSSAILQKPAKTPRLILYITLLSFGWLIAWASYAEIDERVKAEGRVIPSSKVKKIQNLEGGIVKEILVSEGQMVKKGQELIRIDNIKSRGSLGEKKAKYYSLIAKSIRLKAEASDKKFDSDKVKDIVPNEYLESEYNLYLSDKSKIKSKVRVLEDQLRAKKNELNEVRSKMKFLQQSVNLIQEEVNMKASLVKQGIESRPEFLKLKRELTDKKNEYSSARLSIPRIKSEIAEIRSKIASAKDDYKNKAREELSKTLGEISQIKELKNTLEDEVRRTKVVSPVDGIVKKIEVTTIGQVIKSGDSMMEIVPVDDKLLIEAKVKPRDIAFLYPGQKASVKVTAYDFSIYGGLKGEVVSIGADSIVEKTAKGEQSYFLVQIKTDKNYVEKNGKKGLIMPGMVVSADILTGKKTIMSYLMKPIIKAKQNALKER
jgi:adhesin transport system membrane fusion protein